MRGAGRRAGRDWESGSCVAWPAGPESEPGQPCGPSSPAGGQSPESLRVPAVVTGGAAVCALSRASGERRGQGPPGRKRPAHVGEKGKSDEKTWLRLF